MKGVAPKSKIISIKVLNNKGIGREKHVLNGLHWIVDNGKKYNIKVVNLSFGTLNNNDTQNKKLIDEVELLWDLGYVVIAAAGNNGPGPSSISTPGDCKKIVTVGAENDKDVYKRQTVGTYKVKYSYKAKNGTKYNISQKIKVVDTTPPQVRCGQNLYTLQVSSKSLADIVKDDNVKKIENMVKAGVSADEPIVDVQVYTVEKQLLRLDEKVPVVVKAKDTSGNVGSCQVMCQIKYTKSATVRKKVKVNKDFLKKRKKQAGIEETTKKKKQPTKEVNKKTNKDKETASVKETTFKKAE